MEIAVRRRWLPNVAVAAAVAVPTTLDAWWNAPGTRQADAVTYLLLAVSVGALLGRRRAPLAVAVVCGAALTGWYVLGHRGELLSLPAMVALYTVAASGERRRTVVVGLVAVAWSGVVAGVAGGDRSPVAELVWPVAALLLGEVVRGQRALRREYADRQARAEANREREARRRVQAERLRIAREFHDVIAHTMAGVNVQMGVAVAAFDARPRVAREALAQARTASGEALRELRATVALLRDGTAGDTGEPPAPGLAQLDDLAERARRAGVHVTLYRPQPGGPELPAAVELSAYRIVQEALTNVVRHARAAAATVSVSRDDGRALSVEVTDDGAGPPDGDPAPPGYGLTGITERAGALGGRVEYGPMPGGGFRVHATLPLVEGEL